jgi:hypothetical protein
VPSNRTSFRPACALESQSRVSVFSGAATALGECLLQRVVNPKNVATEIADSAEASSHAHQAIGVFVLSQSSSPCPPSLCGKFAVFELFVRPFEPSC